MDIWYLPPGRLHIPQGGDCLFIHSKYLVPGQCLQNVSTDENSVVVDRMNEWPLSALPPSEVPLTWAWGGREREHSHQPPEHLLLP